MRILKLGVRPDGRLLYGTTTHNGAAILQQTMPDGTPDLNFGASGKIEFPLSAGEQSAKRIWFCLATAQLSLPC
jgi:hypothetical protein